MSTKRDCHPIHRTIDRELVILAKVSAKYGIPTGQVAQDLIDWITQPLPDVIPPMPEPVEFKWPSSREVDYRSHWQRQDRSRWLGERL